jgi:signal peptidase I
MFATGILESPAAPVSARGPATAFFPWWRIEPPRRRPVSPVCRRSATPPAADPAAGRSLLSRLVLGRSPKKTFVRILILVVACAITFKFILLPIRVSGTSMEPTCHDGRVGCINLLAYAWRSPQRGDIVGLRTGPDHQLMLKRLIGLPGERIAIRAGTVYINGVALDEPYVSWTGTGEWPEETLDKNTYFVDGDNRPISQQFNAGREQILGKLLGAQP